MYISKGVPANSFYVFKCCYSQIIFTLLVGTSDLELVSMMGRQKASIFLATTAQYCGGLFMNKIIVYVGFPS